LIVHSHVLLFLRATSGGKSLVRPMTQRAVLLENAGGSSNGRGFGAFADPASGGVVAVVLPIAARSVLK
jgi:hypothetical protein